MNEKTAIGSDIREKIEDSEKRLKILESELAKKIKEEKEKENMFIRGYIQGTKDNIDQLKNLYYTAEGVKYS